MPAPRSRGEARAAGRARQRSVFPRMVAVDFIGQLCPLHGPACQRRSHVLPPAAGSCGHTANARLYPAPSTPPCLFSLPTLPPAPSPASIHSLPYCPNAYLSKTTTGAPRSQDDGEDTARRILALSAAHVAVMGTRLGDWADVEALAQAAPHKAGSRGAYVGDVGAWGLGA